MHTTPRICLCQVRELGCGESVVQGIARSCAHSQNSFQLPHSWLWSQKSLGHWSPVYKTARKFKSLRALVTETKFRKTSDELDGSTPFWRSSTHSELERWSI